MPLFQVKDEYTVVLRWRMHNETLVCQLALVQMLVALVALLQHIYSLLRYNTIFACIFEKVYNPDDPSKWTLRMDFLSLDVIIFDFHLFASLLPNLKQCIANYMDDGHMRCLWCVTQLVTLLSLLCLPCIRNPHYRYLWPIMIVQNSYCFGLMFLTIATAQKLLVTLVDFSHFPNRTWFLSVLFICGTSVNYLLNYILWHLYWHLEHVAKVSKKEMAPDKVITMEAQIEEESEDPQWL